jgi:ketosteroid isomerase-like protein
MSRIRSLTAGAALLFAACQAAETPEQMEARMAAEADSVRAAITAMAENAKRWVQGGHADSLASMYAENARMFFANEPIIEGRAAIQDKYAQFFQMGTWDWSPTVLGVVANGPLAVEWGTYTLGFTPAPNAPPEVRAMPPADTGKYVVHWQRINGQWQIVNDIGNTSMPMAPPPGQRRRS